MNNTTIPKTTEKDDYYEDAFFTLWLIGISVSLVGLLIQSFLFIMVPGCRKFDEIILTEMTTSRLLYTTCECYIMFYVQYNGFIVKTVLLVLYIHTDITFVVLMFVFTKNLYNKLVVVFPLPTYNIVLTSVTTWLTPFLISLLCPLLLNMKGSFFNIFYTSYAHIKFVVCVLNGFIFVEILRVAFKRGVGSNRNIRDYLKTACINFVLVSITSLQVCVTDVISYYYSVIRSHTLVLIFCVINSYQVLALTGIFVVLVRSKLNDSMIRLISIKLNNLMSTST
ncbi:hypothetical protein KGM_205462 [Danaus plexippus plexippus]|uniref:Serpentine receptor class gamma n=1 Tax=Danaus plexippus plexippus TaxID=278856 RepID=A0A212F3N9_DANPL|nr:hypothetical protein KGM_205462 [Danaus plexippus plexippus]